MYARIYVWLNNKEFISHRYCLGILDVSMNIYVSMYICTETKKHSHNTGARGCTYIHMHVSRYACMYGMHLAPLWVRVNPKPC